MRALAHIAGSNTSRIELQRGRAVFTGSVPTPFTTTSTVDTIPMHYQNTNARFVLDRPNAAGERLLVSGYPVQPQPQDIWNDPSSVHIDLDAMRPTPRK